MTSRAVWICAGLSLIVHAMAATLWPPITRTVKLAATSPVAWRVNSTPYPHRVGGLTATPPNATRSNQSEPNAAIAAPIDSEVLSEEEPIAASAPASGEFETSREQMWSGYIPRPQLSIAPSALTPIMIEAPLEQREPQRIAGILSIYINESGKVDHIKPSGLEEFPEFEKAALAAFRDMTYTPGQVQGQVVKSRIRIEVVFDNTPLPEASDQPKP